MIGTAESHIGAGGDRTRFVFSTDSDITRRTIRREHTGAAGKQHHTRVNTA
jgi:hypothetical protein